MDWALVLVSQGVEPVIESAEAGQWRLVVAVEDYDRSVDAIRRSRLENLRWPWRKPIFKTRAIFDWGAAAWVGLTCIFYWLSDQRATLRDAGIMDGQAVAAGEWWRSFTAMFLHADLAHLTANVVFGLILVGLAMGRYGTGVGLLAAFLAGAGGNIVSWLARGDAFRGLGASGMVMGALGLLAVQSVGLWRRDPWGKRMVLGGVAGGAMLFALLGVTPGTDIVAHFGGFVAGLGLGAVLTIVGEWPTRPLANLVACLSYTLLVIWVWALALAII